MIALNGIPIDWCVAEDKKRHVVAKVPGALCIACTNCTRTHWKEASKFIEEESKQYDIEVIMAVVKTAPRMLFFNKHTIACLPKDEDVSKYNSRADVGEQFEMIDADHYYTFDRELNPVWDEIDFGEHQWPLATIN